MPSAVVGLLRVLLTANTAEFSTGLKAAANQMQAFSRDLNGMGRQMTSVGTALSKSLTLPLLAIGAGSAKLAVDFESSFAGVRKTVDGVSDSSGKLTAAGQQLAQGFRDLAKTIPVNVNELNKIGEAAGALGIKKEDILEFSSVMAQLGVTTNLTSDQAATSIAQIQNIFNASGKDTKNFASALVALGNAGASTESQIVDFASRLAGAGHQIGLSQQSVLGFSAGLANMGLNAELGGTALSKVMSKISVAVDTGGAKLEAFAKTAGMTGEAFKTLFKSDPTEAILRFTEGLGKAGVSGQNMTIILNDLGLKGSNVQDVMKRLAGGAGQMRDAVDLSTKAWRENTALTNEAGIRFQTTESQMKLLWNRIQDVGITIGNALLPAIKSLIGAFNVIIPALDSLGKGFAAIPGPIQAIIIGFGAVVAAAGPALFIFGQLVSSAGAVSAAFATKGIATRLLAAAFGTVAPAAEGAAASTGLLTGAIGLLTNPITLGVAALGLLAFGIYKVVTAETDLEKSLRENATAFQDHTKEIDKALTTYRELSIRHDLTTKETAELDKVTRLLAGASGLSVEAFKKEEGASGTLTTALAAQLAKRKELYEQAVNQGRTAAADAAAAVAQAQADLDKVLAGKATRTIHTADDRGGQGIAVPLDASERVAEVNRLKAVITDLQVKADSAKASVQALTGGGLKADINLAGPLAAGSKAAQALTDKLTELHDKLSDADETIKGLDASVRAKLTEAIKSGVFSMKELMEATGLSEVVLKRFEDQLKANTKEGTKHQKTLEAQQKATTELASSMSTLTAAQIAQVESLLDQGKAEADIVKSLKVTKTQVNEVQEAYKERVQAEKDAAAELIAAHKSAERDSDKEMADFFAAQDKERAYQKRTTEMSLSGVALELQKNEDARQQEILGLGQRTKANEAFYDTTLATINTFHDHQRDIINKTDSTFVERMKSEGVLTRDELKKLATEAQHTFELIRAARDGTGKPMFSPTVVAAAGEKATTATAAAEAGEFFAKHAHITDALGKVADAAKVMAQITHGAAHTFITDMGEMATALSAVANKTGVFDIIAGGLLKIIAAKTAGGDITKETGAALTGLVTTATTVADTLKKANVSFTNYGDGLQKNTGIATAMFSKSTTSSQKWASGVQSAGAIVSGAMSVWADTAHAGSKAAGALTGAMSGAKAGAAFGPYGVAIGAAAGAVIGLIHSLSAGRRAVKDFAKEFDTAAEGTGFDELHAKLMTMGDSGARMWKALSDAKSSGDAKKAIDAITKALTKQKQIQDQIAAKQTELANTQTEIAQKTQAALEKYGLTWKDMGREMQDAHLDEEANQLYEEMQLLQRAGVSNGIIFGKMHDNIIKYLDDATTYSSSVTDGFGKVIQSMIDTGNVTDQDYDKLHNYAVAAALAGTEIPESFKPIIQKLIDMGYYTDVNNDGIVDLEDTGIHFSQTTTQGFQSVVDKLGDIIKKIDDLIEALKHVGDEAVTQSGRIRGSNPFAGWAVPKPGTGAPPPPPPPSPDGTDTGDTSEGHAFGGIVPSYSGAGARILRFIPKGTDTVPIMATPGEGIVNTSAMHVIGSNALDDLNAGRTSELQATGTTGHAGPTYNFNSGAFSFDGLVVDSSERARELASNIAEELRRGGSLLTKWQNLPLVKDA